MSLSLKQTAIQTKHYKYQKLTIHKSCQLLVKMSNPACLHTSSSWRRQIGVWVHIYIWYQDKAGDRLRPPGSWRRDISNQFQKTDSAVGEFNKLLIFTSVISWDRGNGRASGRILELPTNLRGFLRCLEKSSTGAISLLKLPSSAFTIKNLLTHNAWAVLNWVSMLTKRPVPYDLWGQTPQFYVYFPCLNACLA